MTRSTSAASTAPLTCNCTPPGNSIRRVPGIGMGNQNSKPFIWTANVGQIIAKIERARIKMEQIKPGSTLPRGPRKPVNV
jgi:hypothetical protein